MDNSLLAVRDINHKYIVVERKSNMRKIIAAACLMAAMTLCVGCSSAKDGSKDTTKATTETKMKVQSKYKVPKITAAKKTDQLADAQKGETIVTMKVKGYGEMQFKFFMKKAPLAVKNFVTLASNGYFDGQIFHRVINDFMIQSGDPTGTGTGGESIWGEDFDNEVCEELLPLRGSLCMANSGADTNGSQFFIVQAKADTAKKGLEEGNVELTKKQQALFLDQGGYPSLTGSYTVFGQMINGYDVLDKISGCKTQDNGSGEVSQPVKKVVIEKMTVSNAE